MEGESFRRVSREDNLPSDTFILQDPTVTERHPSISEDRWEPEQDFMTGATGTF